MYFSVYLLPTYVHMGSMCIHMGESQSNRLTYIFGTQAGGQGALSGREPGSTAALLSLSERLTSPQGVALLTGGVAAGSGLG